MLTNVRLALRGWRRKPGLFAAALFTIALGVGANTAVFTAVRDVLFESLPFPDPDRLVMIWGSNPEFARKISFEDKLVISPAAFDDWRRDARSFERLALFRGVKRALTGPGGSPEAMALVSVTGEFFPALGTPPLAGRTLTPEDDRPGAPVAMVIGYAFWQRRFGASLNAIGQTVFLDGQPATIVGIMPPSMQFPRAADITNGQNLLPVPEAWIPMQLDAEDYTRRGWHDFLAFGRVKPDVSVTQANTEIVSIYARVERDHPIEERGWTGRVEPLRRQLTSGLQGPLDLLAGAAALVLLIACANVANLLLVSGASRQREVALRLALGARPLDIVRQLLTESVALALAGGTLGLLLAAWSLLTLRGLLPEGLAHLRALSIDWTAFAFAATLSTLAGVIFGLVPALLVTRSELRDQLNDTSRGASTGVTGRRTRRLLVIAETALAVMLLVVASLLLRSYWSLLQVDPGFRTERAMAFRVNLPGESSREQRIAFFDRLLDRAAALPGVVGAALISELPLTETSLTSITAEGKPLPLDRRLNVGPRVITPDYFKTMGIPLRHGRLLDSRDLPADRVGVVIDEVMAKLTWPGEDPIGKRFTIGEDDGVEPWYEVVGVVGNVRHAGLQRDVLPMFYQPYTRITLTNMTIVVRSAGDPAALTASLRAALRDIAPDQPMSDVRTLDGVVSASVAQRRLIMSLLATFAGLALLLACVGLYGVISYTVTLRTRELGVRAALGAGPAGLLRLIVKEGVSLAAAGIALGLVGATLLTTFVASMLYGVTRWDPVTLVGVPALLALVSVAACVAPGRRAMRVDPMIALRAE
jgi:predicted permease